MDYIFYFGCVVLGWVIFYYTIKGAVKNAIMETKERPQVSTATADAPIKSVWTAGQVALQKRYETGEITIEQYKKDWDNV